MAHGKPAFSKRDEIVNMGLVCPYESVTLPPHVSPDSTKLNSSYRRSFRIASKHLSLHTECGAFSHSLHNTVRYCYFVCLFSLGSGRVTCESECILRMILGRSRDLDLVVHHLIPVSKNWFVCTVTFKTSPVFSFAL